MGQRPRPPDHHGAKLIPVDDVFTAFVEMIPPDQDAVIAYAACAQSLPRYVEKVP